jgi:hypothetical protein
MKLNKNIRNMSCDEGNQIEIVRIHRSEIASITSLYKKRNVIFGYEDLVSI